MREFDTGATRDDDDGKFDYEGFLSPIVLERYAEYMHENRKQSDGELRDSDNWQKGIPIAQYMKSMYRHFQHVHKIHRGWCNDCIEEALCALLFNVMGYLHEILKTKVDEDNIPDEWAGARNGDHSKFVKAVLESPTVVSESRTIVSENETAWHKYGDYRYWRYLQNNLFVQVTKEKDNYLAYVYKVATVDSKGTPQFDASHNWIATHSVFKQLEWEDVLVLMDKWLSKLGSDGYEWLSKLESDGYEMTPTVSEPLTITDVYMYESEHRDEYEKSTTVDDNVNSPTDPNLDRIKPPSYSTEDIR